MIHPIHRRYYAEDLVRRRRAGDARRYAASQRRGRIDANPHQIDAVMFALGRIPDGGCILADEVGLGKTIEAGLVMAQILSEGAERILVVLPRSLLGQWQEELYTLFGMKTLEADTHGLDISGRGVYLVGREWAGTEKGSSTLRNGPPFDLVIIDEAHEIFAGIYRRFDRHGTYRTDSRYATTAHRVRRLIGPSPVLLLTATPMQNSLHELWGLVQYIDRTNTLLGLQPTFKELFCKDPAGRRIASGQAFELQRRLGSIVQRTLRRQAQDFLDTPLVDRHAKLFEYTMAPDERALYDDVTAYLLEPTLFAFRGRARQLLLIGFHRRMASSTAALAKSLEQVVKRLRGILDGVAEADLPDLRADFLTDLEDELEGAEPEDVEAEPSPEAVKAELARVEDFVRRAQALPHDSKAESLVRAVRALGAREEGSDKIVIFTESLTTQQYLRTLLTEKAGLSDDDITLFNGANDSPRARAALERRQEEVGKDPASYVQPSTKIEMRLALVHEFKTRSRVLISTEAGAKGLNLQFCNTIVNYDLPWNPQRIEQRIGRCHRYGQKHDVTVINFLATDNEAQRLVFEILSQKLELFGRVLGMSDEVLHEPESGANSQLALALGPDFESELNKVLDRARSREEVVEEIRRLHDSMDGRRLEIEELRERTFGLIEGRLDESVYRVFRGIRDKLSATLAELDKELERVALGYLEATHVPHEIHESDGRRILEISRDPRLPEHLAHGLTVVVGGSSSLEDLEPLHTSHPLIEAALAEARRVGEGDFRVRFVLEERGSEPLRRRRGSRGRLALTQVSYDGFEREDRLIVTAIFEDSEVLRPSEAAHELLQLPCVELPASTPECALTPEELDEVVDEEIFLDESEVAKRDQASFEKAIDQLDQYMEDRALLLRRRRSDLTKRIATAEAKRDRALGADARSEAAKKLENLELQAEEVDQSLDRIATRQDADYEKWKKHAHNRRYRSPSVKRLFTVEFELS